MPDRLPVRHLRPVAVALLLAASAADARDLTPFDALSRAPVARAAATTLPGVATDPQLGVPRFLWGSAVPSVATSALTAKRALDPEAGARGVLRELAATYRITPAEVDALPMHDLQRLPGGGAVVRFQSRVDGLEVFREEVNVVLDASGALVAIGGFALGAPAAKAAEVEPFAHGPQAGLATALSDWGFAADVAHQAAQAREADGYVFYTLPAGARGDDGATLAQPLRVKRVLYRMPDALVPAYYVELVMHDPAHADHRYAWSYVVAAGDGHLLFRNTLVRDAFSYRVHAEATSPYTPLPGPQGRAAFPYPAATPDGRQPALGTGNLVTLDNAPFSRNDPWLTPTAQWTQGNNVEVFANIFSPDGFGPPGTDQCTITLPVDGDLHGCLSSGTAFDHVYDFSKEPGANRTQVYAAATNAFFTVNWLHDWFYDAGFDEVARNAQLNNYGRGGVANDSLVVQIQDFDGTNNADMATRADGASPFMRQFLWNRGSEAALARVQSPAAIAGVKASGAAEFGATAFDLTSEVVAAQDAGNTTGPSTTDGCTAYTNAAAVAGKIALVDRGTCLFVDKARIAQAAGAAALLVANNVSGNPQGMSGDDPTITIPVVGITQDDGAALRAQLAAGVTLRIARKSAPERDGALDNTVVIHEWGHYLSNRLIANANGIATNQGGGLGEGWSDFVALLVLVKAEDRSVATNANFGGTYAVTQFSLSGPDFAPDVLNQAYYYGIRRYPYSRDLTRNPLTFAHIADSATLPATPAMSPTASNAPNSEVHRTGEVWANMLWECYSGLLNDTGRLSFAQAQDRMKRYLVASLKATPINPTFVEARDALLAVMQAQDVNDRDRCMEGFAKRGLGVGAVAPDRYSETNSGVVESFRATATAPVASTVVEYYHAAFDHYFVTNIADEIAKLDNGTFVGWARTGESFKAYDSGTPGAADVCRFFSTSFSPKSSHFYTPSASECATVKTNPNWQFEAVVFGVPVPDTAGNCAAGTQPVYRLYNNGQGAAPNHRYTTSAATRSTMLGKGWIPEGYGPLGVIACSPL